MRLLEVEIENILSIERANIKFEDSGLVLIEGWNYDAQRANGAGKTAILNAICFALYDRVPRKITATEILRRGTKLGFVRLSFNAKNGEKYVLERSRPKGLRIWVGDQLVDRTQQELELAFGLNYSQFLTSMYSAQGTDSKFLYLNDTSKKDFLLKLLALDDFVLTKKLSDVKSAILEKEVLGLETLLAGVISKIEAYSESISDVNTENIEELRTSILALRGTKEPDLSKFKRIEADIENKKFMFADRRAERSLYHNQYRRLSASIKPFNGSDICESCGAKMDISDAKLHHEQEMEAIKKEMQDLKKMIDDCDTALQKEKEVEDLHAKLKEKLAAESKNYNIAMKRIAELETLIKEKKAQEDLQNKIASLKKQELNLNASIAEKNLKIKMYETVSAMCSPTGAQAYILDSIIDSFNEYVSDYVALVWPNASYKLIAYKENKQGDVTAKFSDQLYMDGVEVSIGSLSGGECKALSLCADFAILDIMKKQFSIDLNPIILDEPFDGLDAVGKEIVIDLLEKLSQERQILVIDHSSEAKTMFTKVIRVEKRSGISNVTLDL